MKIKQVNVKSEGIACYLDAYDIVLDACFQLSCQMTFKGSRWEKKCNSNTLPPSQEHNGLEHKELGQGLNRFQLVLSNRIELYKAI